MKKKIIEIQVKSYDELKDSLAEVMFERDNLIEQNQKLKAEVDKYKTYRDNAFKKWCDSETKIENAQKILNGTLLGKGFTEKLQTSKLHRKQVIASMHEFYNRLPTIKDAGLAMTEFKSHNDDIIDYSLVLENIINLILPELERLRFTLCSEQSKETGK